MLCYMQVLFNDLEDVQWNWDPEGWCLDHLHMDAVNQSEAYGSDLPTD